MVRRLKTLLSKLNSNIKSFYYLWRYYNKEINSNIVLIESKQGKELAGNMFYILKEIYENRNNFEIYLVVKNESKDKIKKLLTSYKIYNVNIVRFNSYEYYKILSTAKYLFNDTSFHSNYVKKEGQVYTNTWHGTPLKMMGDDVDNRKHANGNVKRNFMMCDYLVYPNLEMEEKMTRAYCVDNLYQNNIVNVGYPGNAVFFDRNQEDITREELGLTNKRVIVYMPTWRGLLTDRESDKQLYFIMKSLSYIDKNLNEDDIFYVKMHPLVEQDMDLAKFKHIREFPKNKETYEVLNTADILITDYSSVMFDFANTNKQIILFTYDMEEYCSYRGLYYSIEEFPFPRVNTVQKLVETLNKNNSLDYSDFIEKFCTFDSIDATSKLLNLIFDSNKKDIIVKKSLGNGKPNTLIYVSSLGLNGLTTSILSLLEVIDRDAENLYFCFDEKSILGFVERLEKLPPKSKVFPLVSGHRYTLTEGIAIYLFFFRNIENNFTKKHLESFYQREVLRKLGGAKFDRAIHFTGYESRMIGLFQRIDAKRAILVHSDMIQEIKTRKNQHYLTLKDAYTNYDRVIGISEVCTNSAIEISGQSDNTMILNNAHDYKGIIEKSKEEITFDEHTESNIPIDELKSILNTKATKFINVGRFSPEKGQKRLIDAFERYYINDSNSYLILIGGHGVLWDDLQNHASTLKSKNNIIFIKSIDNPYTILAKCSCLILSSTHEGLGLVILEAATLNIPVITTDIDGTRDFVKAHDGYIVANNEDGIYQGMLDYKDNKVKPMIFDGKEYNKNIKEEYESIFR